MKKQFFTLSILISFLSHSQIKENITYDFSCMETDEISFGINLLSDIEKELLNNLGASVSIEEEVEVGDEVYKKFNNENEFYSSSSEERRHLLRIMNKLIRQLRNPRGFDYEIFIYDKEDEINAFTCGGKIFVTSGMYNFCKSDDELASIIGHEIAHNELGHINQGISRIKTANDFGLAGQLSYVAGNILTTPFNQKNEAHCDLLGIDMAIAAGYNGCDNIKLWNRMKEKYDQDYDVVTNIFSTHPYSGKRMSCSKNHIESNYNTLCPD